MPHTTSGLAKDFDKSDPFGNKAATQARAEAEGGAKAGDDGTDGGKGKGGKKAKKKKQIKSRFDIQREAIDQTARRMGQFLESNTNKELQALRKVYTDPDQPISAQRAAFRESQRLTETFQGRLDQIQTRADISQKRLDRSQRVFNRATQNNVVREERRLERRFMKANRGATITGEQRAQFRTDAITHVGEQAGADLTHFQDRRLEFRQYGGDASRFVTRQGAAAREATVQQGVRKLAVRGPRGRLQREQDERKRAVTDFKTEHKLRRLITMEREGVLTDEESDFLESYRLEALSRQRVAHRVGGNQGIETMRPVPSEPVPKFGSLDLFAGDMDLNVGVQEKRAGQRELLRIDEIQRAKRRVGQDTEDFMKRRERFAEFFPTTTGG